jgi:murein DD-endopeptidase MepM/ murein hydrolase activator NlpD
MASDFKRRGGLQWLPVFLALPLAAGVSHWWMEHRDKPPETPVVQQVEVAPPTPRLRQVSGEFRKNQTVSDVFLAQGMTTETVHQIIQSTKPIYDLAKVHAGRLWSLRFTEDGGFHEFRYPVDPDHYLTVSRDEASDNYVPVLHEHQFETQVERIDGSVASSLFAAVTGIGENQDVAIELGDIFGSDIDFNTDVQKGDSFQALIERKYLDGKLSRNGAILAASFTNEGKTFTGIRFTDENGKPAYYAPDGKALRKSFLKAPLKVIRITSRFTTARRHPILKIVRPHLGVDYAAPTGTPVQAVGDGTVTFAGWSDGGGGRTISLRHAGGYETKYMHLSRIRVKRGQRVSQGDVIGDVGASGLATGPHLDFRVYKNGQALNPTKVVVPPGMPVAKEKMAEFKARCDLLTSELATRRYAENMP